MTPKLTMGAKTPTASAQLPVRLVVVTMDTHLAGAIERAQRTLKNEIPGLTLTLHAASEYAGNDAAIERCIEDIRRADIVVAGMLFMEDHFLPILPALQARREQCDAMICMASAAEVVKLTRLGNFDTRSCAAARKKRPLAALRK